MANAPFLILEAGKPVPELRRHGDFPHWIRVAAGLHRDEAVVVDLQAGEPLPTTDAFAGVIVSGSGAMVSEREPWSEAAAKWLGSAARAGMPVFGICYGHQLLAHGLGGEVGDNPRGREMGTVEVELLPAASDDLLLQPLPARFSAQLTHQQTVLRLPEGAVVLARSAGGRVPGLPLGEERLGRAVPSRVQRDPHAWLHPRAQGAVAAGRLRYGRHARGGQCRPRGAAGDAALRAPRACRRRTRRWRNGRSRCGPIIGLSINARMSATQRGRP
ncbi:GMP synthase (glutamine-hydrolysing) [Lysobacter spongiicola DSM 21749]|uniref:GMP synthase (Glutamine-hydrolysing) n=1 Tax=Lysobacter spongiicola DSM 21749 TaxID=1122188 RepID=A0A1T4SCY9_9GAMM|nr:GMP synthase (glutamine-hydrolysing) [Lysobacter spongiicola DSM 21749]